MKEYLSIGEVAKLLGTTIHNIRYYEKEKLVSFNKRTEKNYRLFSLDDIYKLSAIMMLRDADIPIKDIRELLNKSDASLYKEMMLKSSENLKKRIDELTLMKSHVDELILEHEDLMNTFTIRELNDLSLLLIKETDINGYISEKEIYDFAINNRDDINEFHKLDLIIEIDYTFLKFYVQGKDTKDKIPKGKYLIYTLVMNEEDIEREFDVFIKYITDNQINTTGPIYLKTSSTKSLMGFNDESLVYEYLIKVV